MSDTCESAGGWVFGKVFHDQNGNGIYDERLGETGFRSSTPVNLELLNCRTSTANCDRHDYFNPANFFRRTFPISLPDEQQGNYALCPDAENGGCFSFFCPDCYGDFRVVLSRTLDPDFEGWYNSPFRWGDYREGWSFSEDPHITCNVRNNFERFESPCFSLRDGVKVVVDFGILFNTDVQQQDMLYIDSIDDHVDSVTISSLNEENDKNEIFDKAPTLLSTSSFSLQRGFSRRRRKRKRRKRKRTS